MITRKPRLEPVLALSRLDETFRGQRHDGLSDRVGRVLDDHIRVCDPRSVIRVPGTRQDPAAQPAAGRRERGLGATGHLRPMGVDGTTPPCFATIARAARCKLRARRL